MNEPSIGSQASQSQEPNLNSSLPTKSNQIAHFKLKLSSTLGQFARVQLEFSHPDSKSLTLQIGSEAKRNLRI